MGMEDDAVEFLLLLVNSIALVLMWMILQVLLGIYLGFAFFEGKPAWQNILYYIFFLDSFALLFRHLKKKWRDQLL